MAPAKLTAARLEDRRGAFFRPRDLEGLEMPFGKLQGDMKAIPMQVPPTPEQRAMAARIEGVTAGSDALLTKVGDAGDRLKELRTARLSAVVTGKIDVRGEAVA